MGITPHAIWLRPRNVSGGSHPANLTPMVMTSINTSEPPQSWAAFDSAIAVRKVAEHLVVDVNGRAAVERTFAPIPDSVSLAWPTAGGGTRGLMLPVVRMESGR